MTDATAEYQVVKLDVHHESATAPQSMPKVEGHSEDAPESFDEAEYSQNLSQDVPNFASGERMRVGKGDC